MKLFSTIFSMLILVPIVSADSTFTFDVQETTRTSGKVQGIEALLKARGDESSAEEPPKEIVEQYSLTVAMGDQFIGVHDEQAVKIYDFEQKHITVLNKADKTGITMSLFSDLGFRKAEFANRLKIAEVMKSAGLQSEQGITSSAIIEHQFSLLADKDQKVIQERKDGTVRYSIGDTLLFGYTGGKTKITAWQRERVIVFLRYKYGVHPLVVGELAEMETIPGEMTIYHYFPEPKDVKITLQAVGDVGERTLFEGYSLNEAGSDEVTAITAGVSADRKQDYDKACKLIIERAVAAAKESNNLEAVTLFLGYTLLAGAELPREFYQYRDQLTSDPDGQALIGSLSPRNEDEAQKAIETFDKLAEKVKHGKPFIYVYKANIHGSIGQYHEAMKLFLMAVKTEPMLVGAWKDIGDLYYNNYETAQAWYCWDFGRSLNPDHSLFTPINKMEKSMLKDHPGFFLVEEE